MKGLESINHHQRFKELVASATANALNEGEWVQLKNHLLACEECEEVFRQYRKLATEFIPVLALQYHTRLTDEQDMWDDTPVRRALFRRVQLHRNSSNQPADVDHVSSGRNWFEPFRNRLVPVCVAAALCLVVTVGYLASRQRRHDRVAVDQSRNSEVSVPNSSDAEKTPSPNDLNRVLDAQIKRSAQLEEANSQAQQLVAKLRVQLETLNGQIGELKATNQLSLEQLAENDRERDSLTTQLQEAKKAYNDTRAELVNVRQERDELLVRSGLLETKLREASTIERNQEDRLAEYERYMASDRDIRELMGARKLYIADVFDVDGYSRTQKPFGRIFYTEGKSLIFYAFDLQDRTKSANASAFQVWGKTADLTRPVNLGILYMDNESNRRWLLRVDDPDQLARINSVFVTVEPHGGSQEPTSKPFLYALLWQKANHP